MYVYVIQWTGGGLGGKNVILESRKNGMFECRGNIGEKGTEEGKSGLHLLMHSDSAPLVSLTFDSPDTSVLKR